MMTTTRDESPNSPTLPKRRAVLERPAVRKKVEGFILDGLSDGAIARQLKVSRQAITAFRHRHADEVQAAVAEVERQISDAAIASKVNRILDADADYQRLGQVIQARAADTRYDEPGYATGLMAHSLKQMGAGKYAVTVDEYKVDTAVIAERRSLRNEVANELGQLPKPDAAGERTFVLIRERIIERGERLEPLG